METQFGWDASHFDGALSAATLRQAKAEGIVFFTHKIGEGLTNDDPTDGTALAAARDAGIEFLGGYYVNHQGLDPVAQARRCVQLADRDEPWWRQFPGWFWQVDAEKWSPTDRPTPIEVKQFADWLAGNTGRTTIVYASRGQYGDELVGLGHPLWNANYGADRPGQFKDVYAAQGGDNGPGWGRYSGQVPVFWQYTSAATIAGRTTCDANAFRGTVDDLRRLIQGADAMTPAQQYVQHVLNYRLEALISGKFAYTVPAFTATDGSHFPAVSGANAVAVGQQAILKAVAQVGTNGGTPVDVDAIVARVNAEVRDAVADLGEGGAAQVRANP